MPELAREALGALQSSTLRLIVNFIAVQDIVYVIGWASHGREEGLWPEVMRLILVLSHLSVFLRVVRVG